MLVLHLVRSISRFENGDVLGVVGNVNRLVYGVDSYGFGCGSVNKWGNQSFDLTSKSKLYYLNTLDLIEPTNFAYAKSICVDKCPSVTSQCNMTTSLPCMKEEQYRLVQ
jgi:hypothetical protein